MNDSHKDLNKSIIFLYSSLGQPFFVRRNATDCYRGISPKDWTANELRLMADFIDKNPESRRFRDGS